MLSHFRLASSPVAFRRCLSRPQPRPSTSCSRRTITSSIPRHTELAPEPPTPEEAEALAQQEEAGAEEAEVEFDDRPAPSGLDLNANQGKGPQTYKQFMEEIGDSFKDAQPRKWLGNEVPFPMNPTFKPPPPLSSEIRERMYNAFMQDPEKNSVRALAQRYHVSIKRVDAILRLKGLEKDWQKGKQLQTGFQAGMEKLLMVKSISPSTSVDADRYDVHEADTLEHDENRDASRQRYQRLYWESTPEDGREPVVPGSLEHATFLAKRFAAEAQKLKANPKLMPRIPDKPAMVRPQAKIVQVSRPGRATLQFVDVGAKFMDVNERVRRIVTAKRKARRSRI